MHRRAPTIEAELELLQRESFSYFVHEANPANGLVIDRTAPDWPASIAATGFALAAYPVGVERGFMARAAAAPMCSSNMRSTIRAVALSLIQVDTAVVQQWMSRWS
jgi:hypothetical protein